MTRALVVSLGTTANLADIKECRPISWAECVANLTADPPVTDDKASPGWWIPAEFNPPYRDSKNLKFRHALTFDYDSIQRADVPAIQAALGDIEYLIYTTASHTEERPRIRVVIPTDRPMTAAEFGAVSRKVAARAGIELASRESHVPAQMMFMPSVRTPGAFRYYRHEGPWLSVDDVLAEYDNWEDRTAWPARAEGDSTHAAEAVTPPAEKVGIVGDFCRAYDIPAAIEAFDLPYEPTANPNRWTYTGGSRPEGAVVYDHGQKLHSHHDTDPARGQHNSFDLVRLHLFGKLDEGRPPGPITDTPSFRAMTQFAADLEPVRRGLALVDFTPLPPRSDAELAAAQVIRKANPAAQTPVRFTVQPATTFARQAPLEWIVKGVLPRAELAVVYGESGSGKSFWVLDLVAAIQRGVPWQGRKVLRDRVVVVVAEGIGGFRQRLRAYVKHFDTDLGDMPGVVPDAPNLLDLQDTDALIDAVRVWGRTGLIVVDTLSATTPGANENSGEDMGRVLSHCKRLHRATGAMVVLIHHSGKDASRGARGWSGLKAAADVEIEVTRRGDTRTATLTKLKDGEDGLRWSFQLLSLPLEYDADGEVVTSCVVEHVDPSRVVAADVTPGRDLPGVRGVVYEAARRTMAPGDVKPVDELIDDAVRQMPWDKTKRDLRRQAARRALQWLVQRGLLCLTTDGDVALVNSPVVDDETFEGKADGHAAA